jgi:Ca2+-binding RTX toxin-like protein
MTLPWSLLAATIVAALAAASPGADVTRATSAVVCDRDAGVVSLELPAGTEDRVTPGWRRSDGAVRIRYVTKGDLVTAGDRICRTAAAEWERVEVSLNDLDDETTRFGINRQFGHLPDEIRFFVKAGDGDFDEIRGYNGSDRLDGGRGVDELRGYGGRDRIIGGSGEDQLFAGGQADVIDAADGERDFVRCGYGDDLALTDHFDDVKPDCERVRMANG